MKTIVILFLLCGLWLNVVSQAPQKMSYQALIRNSSGELVPNHPVGMKITILQGSVSGTIVYQELVNPNPQTNASGLLSIVIGSGIPQVGTFSLIDWSAGPYFLQTETDPQGGANYTMSGTSQLLSVPYALHAVTAEKITDSSDFVTVTGNQTITGIKTFSKDLTVNNLTIGKGKNAQYSNTVVGNSALFNNTTGSSNTAIGFSTLQDNTEGIANTAVGINALSRNTKGHRNTALGVQALSSFSEGHDNTAIGYVTLGLMHVVPLISGNGSLQPVFFNTGSRNTATGSSALALNVDGNGNTATGFESLRNNTSGHFNTATGDSALYSNRNGKNNSGFGFAAGFANTTGSYNVFLGSRAGYYETGSNKLYIDNQSRANETDARKTALIYGVFDTDPANQVLTINGSLDISNHKINNVATPVNDKDAVNKAYVDSIKKEIKQEIYAEMGVSDIDGNHYKAVKIGNQVWMAENLKTTRYNDGSIIPVITGDVEWRTLTTGACCWYNNNIENKTVYGALYNWYAVNTGKLCPDGWHVPSDGEWTMLSNFLGGEMIAGGKLKETGTNHWLIPNTGATNASGFTALPGGLRNPGWGAAGNPDSGGNFDGIGKYGHWHTSTAYDESSGTRRYLSYNAARLDKWDPFPKGSGFSVRCIKNHPD